MPGCRNKWSATIKDEFVFCGPLILGWRLGGVTNCGPLILALSARRSGDGKVLVG